MDNEKLMYQSEHDEMISKRHLMHVYRGKFDRIFEDIAYSVKALKEQIADNETKLNALNEIDGSDEQIYYGLEDKSREALSHFIESELENEILLERFTGYFQRVAKNLKFYFNSFQSDEVLTRQEKASIYENLSLAVLEIEFLAESCKEFLTNSSNNRQEKLQGIFLAETFAQMNSFFKRSPWDSLKAFKMTYCKEVLSELVAKSIAYQNDAMYESGQVLGQTSIFDETTKNKMMTEIHGKFNEECVDEIIATWNQCADIEFVQNSALDRLRTKFKPIAIFTVDKTIHKFVENEIEEQLEAKSF